MNSNQLISYGGRILVVSMFRSREILVRPLKKSLIQESEDVCPIETQYQTSETGRTSCMHESVRYKDRYASLQLCDVQQTPSHTHDGTRFLGRLRNIPIERTRTYEKIPHSQAKFSIPTTQYGFITNLHRYSKYFTWHDQHKKNETNIQ